MNLLHHLNQLIVLSFEVEPSDGDFLQTKNYSHIFRPETCARQLWVLSQQQFDALPLGEREWILQKTSKRSTGHEFMVWPDPFNFFIRGEDAYARLLQILCGQFSEKFGAEHVLRQFRDAWQIYCAQSAPENRKIFSDLVNAVFEDVKKIRRSLMVYIKPRDEYQILRKVLQPPKDRVLLITDRPSALDPVLASLGRTETAHIDQIHYCYIGDDQGADQCELVVATAYDKKRLTADCTPITPDQVFKNFPHYPYTILCHSIENQPTFRQNLIAVAEKAGPRSPIIAYVKGQGEKNEIDAAWKKLSWSHFWSPAEFANQKSVNTTMNKIIECQTLTSAHICARARAIASKAAEQALIDAAAKETQLIFREVYNLGKPARELPTIPTDCGADPEANARKIFNERGGVKLYSR